MPRRSEYEIPVLGTPADRLHGWLMDAVSEGKAWLDAQKPAQQWQSAVELMEGSDSSTLLADQSNTNYPKTKRMGRELVASLSNFEHAGEFITKWDQSLYDQAHMLTLLDRDWYRSVFAGEQHREGLQNAVFKGTNYWYEEWDKTYWGPGKGDIRLSAIDPADVFFVQMPANRDIQAAYMVIIRFPTPLNLARRIYQGINPAFAANLVPDRESPGFLQKGLQKVQQFLSPALRVAGRTQQTQGASYPIVDIYKAYTLDNAINESLQPVRMGPQGANWSYTVPFVGQDIVTDQFNESTGAYFTRPARPDECRLFPLRRFTVFSSSGVATDDTSPYWHGEVPLARAWFNDLPWNAIGGSLITDTRSMEEGISALMRGIEDSAAARIDPPAIFDDQLVSMPWAKAFNPRAAGVRAAASLQAGNPITYPIPPQSYDIPPWITNFMDRQEERMEYITCVRDLVAVAKAKQIPGADTMEKLLEMSGPVVQDMVKALVKPVTQLGNWRASYFLQFYNMARIVNAVGPDDGAPDLASTEYISPKLRGMLENQRRIQFHPDMIIPPQPNETPAARRDRAQRMITEFEYEVTESGLNEIHRMTSKLFYLQLMKEGFPISWWTFAKIARIPNFGPPPQGTNTELERWVAQQRIAMEFQQKLQEEAGMTGAPPEGEGGAPGGGKPEGRPQSYQSAPRLVQKDGGARTTVSTAAKT